MQGTWNLHPAPRRLAAVRSALILLLALLLLPAQGAALPGAGPPCPEAELDCAPIRPGARLVAPYDCTLNFVFRDGEGRLYVGTAGHCTDHVGQRVSARGAPDMGEVVYRRAPGHADFALLRIDVEDERLVSPRVCGVGGPTDAAPDVVANGTQAHVYGQAYGVREAGAARGRDGVLTDWRDDVWKGLFASSTGDSGAPVLLATGEAAGHLTMLQGGFAVFPARPPTTWFPNFAGPRLSHAMATAEAATGLDLELMTAPLATAEERARDVAATAFVC